MVSMVSFPVGRFAQAALQHIPWIAAQEKAARLPRLGELGRAAPRRGLALALLSGAAYSTGFNDIRIEIVLRPRASASAGHRGVFRRPILAACSTCPTNSSNSTARLTRSAPICAGARRSICFSRLQPARNRRFEIAGKRLGADVMNMSVSSSSMRKGETLMDTAVTLNAMHPDILVVRHHASGAVELLARKVDGSVINAGDGAHEHPDSSTARCADHPPQQGPHRRPGRCDLRRRDAFARRTLQHFAAEHHGRAGARCRTLHAAATRHRTDGRRGRA